SWKSGVENVVLGFDRVSQSTEAAGLSASSFSILAPRFQADRHRSRSLCKTGEATTWASSNVAFQGTCQNTLPVAGSNAVIESAVHTTNCWRPPAVITTGAL